MVLMASTMPLRPINCKEKDFLYPTASEIIQYDVYVKVKIPRMFIRNSPP
jgi:hypothetical protein